MIRVNFTAARGLTGFHAVGDVVALSFSAQELNEGARVSRDVQEAIGGAREVLLHNSRRTWRCTTGPLRGATLDAVEEFLRSCEGGEQFEAQWWRFESGPALDADFANGRLVVAESVTCSLESEGFDRQRIIGEGTGGANDWYSLSFTAIEVPQ